MYTLYSLDDLEIHIFWKSLQNLIFEQVDLLWNNLASSFHHIFSFQKNQVRQNPDWTMLLWHPRFNLQTNSCIGSPLVYSISYLTAHVMYPQNLTCCNVSSKPTCTHYIELSFNFPASSIYIHVEMKNAANTYMCIFQQCLPSGKEIIWK